MSTIPESPQYTSEPAGTALLNVDGKFYFKLYFLQILGRAQRSRYEWASATRSKAQTVAQLKAQGIGGVGFVCIFPHITKVFFFGSSGECRETNLYIRAFGGDPLQPISLEYGEGIEIACAGEMDIASKEFALWQRCASVEEYLDEFVNPSICSFENHQKLKSFLSAQMD
jgi:hypothetical protein